jgi:predicted nucleic acid-binding protein
LSDSSLIIIADTNILINFLRINRLDLIARHSHQFVITEHVRDEITEYYPVQRQMLQKAIDDGTFTEKAVNALDELQLFGKLMSEGRIGSGECSAIACAICSGYKLAIDDKRAIKEAYKVSGELEILGTQELMVSMISEQLLQVDDADEIKNAWETEHRFKLKISSFRDVLGSE